MCAVVRSLKTPPEPARGRVPLAASKLVRYKRRHRTGTYLHKRTSDDRVQRADTPCRFKSLARGTLRMPAKHPPRATSVARPGRQPPPSGRPRGRLTSGTTLSGAYLPCHGPSGSQRGHGQSDGRWGTPPAPPASTPWTRRQRLRRAPWHARAHQKPGRWRSRHHPGCGRRKMVAAGPGSERRKMAAASTAESPLVHPPEAVQPASSWVPDSGLSLWPSSPQEQQLRGAT